MKRYVFFLTFISFQALAQYSGPAVNTCIAYATAEIRQGLSKEARVVFGRDAELTIERYTRRLGSQFVSSLLFGNGAIIHPVGTPIEMSFLCLLADEKRPLFFSWMPRRDAPVLAQCRRTREVSACLEALLLVAERDLTEAYSERFIEARQIDAPTGAERATEAFRKSADAFKAYRNAECARRAESDERRACIIEITRRRRLDLR